MPRDIISPGTGTQGTYTTPSNISGSATLTLQGGGAASYAAQDVSGGGGGGGACSVSVVTLAPSTGYAYKVAGVQALASSNGMDTTFTIGGTTYKAVGGVTNNGTNGGSGGLASLCVGDTKYNGGNGGSRSVTLGVGGGGGGAGSGGDGGNGGAGFTATGGTGGIGGVIGLAGGNGGTGTGLANNPPPASPGGGEGGSLSVNDVGTGGQIVVDYSTADIPAGGATGNIFSLIPQLILTGDL